MDIGKDIQLPFIPEENAGEEANKRWRDEISEAIKELHTGLIKSPDVTPPIGAIIAWHEDFTNTPALPDGWVECNGLPLDDPDSVYDGQTIPDLNGDERFLRGSSTSGTEQPDAFQGHFHDVVP
ncbi:hypothetical protein, partial [Neptuniibacter sp.]|uniref:hypothetical protein n=1 Tax=Neptuniibacter sp. TaxID=1962643 RepID=UPI002611A391